MKTLDRIKNALAAANSALDIQQLSTIRDDNKMPIGVNLSIENNSRLFHILINLRDDLELVEESLKHL